MSQNTPHQLSEEFPDKLDRLHALKEADTHFRKLAEDYHTVNRAIHRAETNVEPLADYTEAELRKQRMLLKDQIALLLAD